MENKPITRKQIRILGRAFSVCGDPADRYFREYVRQGRNFQDAPITLAWRYCPDDAVCVDVGANIGLATLAFSRVAAGGRVIAFEPSPRSFALLQRNVLDNGLANVECVDSALSNQVGSLDLIEDQKFLAGSRIQTHAQESDGPVVRVAASTLDHELSRRGIERLDILKIDVEGFEQEVLEGAVESLRRYRPMCVIEFNTYALVYLRGVTPRAFLSCLESIFPRIHHLDPDTLRLNEITGRGDEFLRRVATTGFVDDLVCTFRDLPHPLRPERPWILRLIGQKVRRMIGRRNR